MQKVQIIKKINEQIRLQNNYGVQRNLIAIRNAVRLNKRSIKLPDKTSIIQTIDVLISIKVIPEITINIPNAKISFF